MREKILALIAMLTLIGVIGVISYSELLKTDVKMIVELNQEEDPFVAIRQIVPFDSAIKEVREVDRFKNEYEITITTKRKKEGLLEWFTNSHRVKSAEIKDDACE